MQEILIFAQEQALLVGALALLIYLFFRHESAAGGAKLSTSETIQAVNSDKAIVVDVRDAKDFDKGHMASALNIPHAKVADSIAVLEKYREKQIIVTDKLGQHSGSVAKTLMKEGFAVARMRGGMEEWKQDGLPTIKK